MHTTCFDWQKNLKNFAELPHFMVLPHIITFEWGWVGHAPQEYGDSLQILYGNDYQIRKDTEISRSERIPHAGSYCLFVMVFNPFKLKVTYCL